MCFQIRCWYRCMMIASACLFVHFFLSVALIGFSIPDQSQGSAHGLAASQPKIVRSLWLACIDRLALNRYRQNMTKVQITSRVCLSSNTQSMMPNSFPRDRLTMAHRNTLRLRKCLYRYQPRRQWHLQA